MRKCIYLIDSEKITFSKIMFFQQNFIQKIGDLDSNIAKKKRKKEIKKKMSLNYKTLKKRLKFILSLTNQLK